MDSQIVASVIAVLGTLGGAAVTAWIQRETKKIASLERRVERYKVGPDLFVFKLRPVAAPVL